jgi:hypothetical protein
MATVNPNWKPPVPPVKNCPGCGGVVKPVAVLDEEGWCLGGWDCDRYCGQVEEEHVSDIDWPFLEDVAGWEDLEQAGFVTV